jgi:hypothetical protein
MFMTRKNITLPLSQGIISLNGITKSSLSMIGILPNCNASFNLYECGPIPDDDDV